MSRRGVAREVSADAVGGRWTEEEARTALAAQERSGMSPSQYAARKRIDVQRLYSTYSTLLLAAAGSA